MISKLTIPEKSKQAYNNIRVLDKLGFVKIKKEQDGRVYVEASSRNQAMLEGVCKATNIQLDNIRGG